MGKDAYWVCRKCGFECRVREAYLWRCPSCGSPLYIEFEREWKPGGYGVGRYKLMLPVEPVISLGEASTPIVERRVMGARVYFKLEHLNPTGSFKDRGVVEALSHSYKMGFRSVVEDSSGNTGISVAAYASALGVEALIVVPRSAPEGKKNLLKTLGARVIEAQDRGLAYKQALELSRKHAYIAHLWNPLFIEGVKTMAYESFEQGFSGNFIITPVGSGTLMLGLYWGFKDLVEAGVLDHTPRVIAVQGASLSPLYDKLCKTKPSCESMLADGIMVPDPPRIDDLINALRESRGSVHVVCNDDVVRGLKLLVKMGFIVEPTSAVSIAVLEELVNDGVIGAGDTVLIPLTGSGLKMASELYKLVSQR